MEGEEWSCELVAAHLLHLAGNADVAILPLRAASALPLLSDRPTTRVILEIDARTVFSRPEAGAMLDGLRGRIAGVVARGPRAGAWASRHLNGSSPVWVVPDPAARKVELEATALRFGFPLCETPLPQIAQGVELWFCEPGDHIDAAEVEWLARAWGVEDSRWLVVAPPFIRSWLTQAGLKARGLDWSPATLHKALKRAERCVFFGTAGYGLARRQVLALRSGATASLPTAPAPSATAFEPAQVGAAWAEALNSILAPKNRKAGVGERPLRLLILIDLVQDLDPLLPLLDELQARSEVVVEVTLTTWVKRRSPRVVTELANRRLPVQVIDRIGVVSGAGPNLDGVDAVLAVAESSLQAHAPAHALFNRARSANIPTFAFQHGVENVGLHEVAGAEEASVAADHMFVWFPPSRTPETVPQGLKPRLVHVGRSLPPHPDLSDLNGAFAAFDSVVAVFENLHWSRYDHGWRSRFLADCAEFALSDGSRAVILKPHHAGLWSVKNRHLIPQWPSNLIVADPTDPFWEPYTAGALVRMVDAVITTPSTVALDAVQAGKPVAVAAYGLDLPAYWPLPLLHELDDWSAFVSQAGAVEDARRRAAFMSRAVQGDEPARRTYEFIVAAAREARRKRFAATAR